MKRRLTILVVALLLIGAVYSLFFLKNGRTGREEIITVPRGVGVSALADTLRAHGLIRSRLTFQLAARVMGTSRKLHAGLYRITPGLSNLEIIQRLLGSEYALVLQATFPEGITMYHAAAIAHEKLGLDSTIFIRFATDTAFLHSLGVPTAARSAEGYLFPDTYEFLLSADPKGLITRMVKRWKRIVADSLFVHAPKQSLTPTELMTMASIVEAEARLASERDTIAGVYLNRLKIGMKLDADPTVQYGLHLTRPITHEDLLTPTPYNTYARTGLPPGPICSPGAASVRAVLEPAKHPYLYFVARRDGTGGHYFSRTLADQSRMINRSRSNAAASATMASTAAH